jgi:hypothetical protein
MPPWASEGSTKIKLAIPADFVYTPSLDIWQEIVNTAYSSLLER